MLYRAILTACLLSLLAASPAALTITFIGNSIDLPLVEGYLDNFRGEGFDVQTITAQELQPHKDDPVILILGSQNAPEGIGEITQDVMNEREKAEALLYDAGHIPGAINLPEREFEQSLSTLDNDATYLLYCGGNSQSIRVGGILSQNNFKKLYRIADGYAAWRKAGYPRA